MRVPAVGSPPALSTSDSIVWTDRVPLQPDLVCSFTLWRFYEVTPPGIPPVAPARAPVCSAGKHMPCALGAPRWSCHLLTGHHEAGARDTMPLRDLPGDMDVMRHAPHLALMAAPRHAG